MQLLRDNLTLWTSDTQGEGEDANEGGDQNWWTQPLLARATRPSTLRMYVMMPKGRPFLTSHSSHRQRG